MGYSGLIYAAIVAAWLSVLVPRWVRRNEEVERARETDAANGVRVLVRDSKPTHAPHRVTVADPADRTILAGSPAGLESPDDASSPDDDAAVPAYSAPRESNAGSEGDGRDAAPREPVQRRSLTRDEVALRRFERTCVHTSMRRRRMLLVLLLTTVAVIAGTYLDRLPGWSPAVAGAALVGFLAMARRAAVGEAERRAVLRRRAARARVRAEARERRDEMADTGGKRIAVLDVPDVPPGPREDTWEPVDVPLPTYMTKPKAPRVARTIDLSQPGSWTSGRLEPGKSYELPSRAPATPTSTPAASGGSPASAGSAAAESDGETGTEERETKRAVGE